MARKRRKKGSSKSGGPRCGLCGKSGELVRTECCGEWVCDDEGSYQLFSYSRDSCSRNHRRYTLCGFHHAEQHDGRWQECSVCRNEFETEMFVYYGTNEYNFELLANPPKYAPTLCSRCGTRINLGEDGYSQKGEEYSCAACTNAGFPGLAALRGELDPGEDDDPYDPDQALDPAFWSGLSEDERLGMVEEHHRRADIELPNARLHAVLHVIVENQVLLGGETPVASTLERLVREGLCRHDAIHAIAGVLAPIIVDIMDQEIPSPPGGIYDQKLAELTAEGWLAEFS